MSTPSAAAMRAAKACYAIIGDDVWIFEPNETSVQRFEALIHAEFTAITAERDLYKKEFSDCVKACAWMQDGNPLNLPLGKRLTVEGIETARLALAAKDARIAALSAQLADARRDIDRAINISRAFEAKLNAYRAKFGADDEIDPGLSVLAKRAPDTISNP